MKVQFNEVVECRCDHPYIEADERALLKYHNNYEYGNKNHWKVYDLLAVEANQLARKIIEAQRRRNIQTEKKAFRKHFVDILAESLTKHFENMTPKQAVEMAQAALGEDRVTTWIWKPGPQSKNQQHSLFGI